MSTSFAPASQAVNALSGCAAQAGSRTEAGPNFPLFKHSAFTGLKPSLVEGYVGCVLSFIGLATLIYALVTEFTSMFSLVAGLTCVFHHYLLLFMSTMMPQSSKGSCSYKGGKAAKSDLIVIIPYAVFLTGAATMRYAFSVGFSSILTFSAGLQGLAFVLLALKVRNQEVASGLSGKMVVLYAATLCFRLSSTVWLNGYIPMDRTGDWAYQAIEAFSLCMIAYLIRCVFFTHRARHHEAHDSLPIDGHYVIIGCFILAMMVHPCLNNLPLFDIFWTTGCYLETFAMLPQLWMLSKIGEEVEALTSHFVVLSALSRLCSLMFWYRGFSELMPPNGVFNLPGWLIVGAHVAQVLLVLDFVYLYLKSISRAHTALPDAWEV